MIGHLDVGLGDGLYVDKYEYTFAKTIAALHSDDDEEDNEEYEDDI